MTGEPIVKALVIPKPPDRHFAIVEECYRLASARGKIARKLDRSAGTIQAQIHSHNESIERMGYCAECRHLKGNHEMTKTISREA